MISHHHQCCFIHIPKTAGSSICQKLGMFSSLKRGMQDHRTVRELEVTFYPEKKSLPEIFRYYKRMTYDMRKGIPRISRAQFRSYFKFTFVRNPWARVYSWYKNVIRDEGFRARLQIREDCSFRDFIAGNLDSWALQSQLNWIKDAQGRIPLDFIGRFENLPEEFGHVCDMLGIEDKRLPELLVSGNPSYVDAYDDVLTKKVAQKYAEEIEMFDFKFGE